MDANALLTPLPRLYAVAGGLALLAGVLGHALCRHRCRAAIAPLPTLTALGLGFAALLFLGTDAAPGRLPAITLEKLDGSAVALATLPDGAPVIIHLWAAECPPCRRMTAAFTALQRDNNVRIVSVNQGDDLLVTIRHVDTLAARRALPFNRVLRDPQQRLMAAFNTRQLPFTLLVDAHGRVQQHRAGPLGQAALEGWLNVPSR
ncbi:hypothetical protein GCM10022228_20920 [Halomonas cibimaris]|uniref:Thioredoxin domain-containing protein n=1 Tax=Halomonas cibimaris TaxID=657012 RepID=A0ABP7M1B0_9GAMM